MMAGMRRKKNICNDKTFICIEYVEKSQEWWMINEIIFCI